MFYGCGAILGGIRESKKTRRKKIAVAICVVPDVWTNCRRAALGQIMKFSVCDLFQVTVIVVLRWFDVGEVER